MLAHRPRERTEDQVTNGHDRNRRSPALMVAPLTSSSAIIAVIIALQIRVIMAVDGRVGGSDALPVGGWAALAGFLIIACVHADPRKNGVDVSVLL